MGDVDADPAPVGYAQADISPSVAGQVGFVGSVKITAHIARSNAQAAAHRHHHMRLVLAHAGTGLKGLQCCCADAGAVLFVAHGIGYGLAQGQQLADSGRTGQDRFNKAPAEKMFSLSWQPSRRFQLR
jgi:hypothetical protein